MKKCTLIYGEYGDGKSSYSRSLVPHQETLILGTGSKLRELISFQWGGLERHLADNKRNGIDSISVTYQTVNEAIKSARKPYLLFDEWTELFYMSKMLFCQRYVTLVRR